MNYEYIAKSGGKYRIKPFIGYVELRKEHNEILVGNVSYIDSDTLRINTPLVYEVGQGVSIGGFISNTVNFRLIELSITNQPVFENARIISRKVKNDN